MWRPNSGFWMRNEKFGGTGSILSLQESNPKLNYSTYFVVGGILEQEAIHLLQSFYKENPKAPKPQRAVEPAGI